MTEDTPQEKQENEIEALKAIFADDIENLRDDNANKWEPIDVLLSLYPQQGSSGLQERHCMIRLHVMCTEQYPDVEPKLEIKSSKGLSDAQLNDLLGELQLLSSKLKGEVVIFELAQHVQTYLHQYNKPGYESFWHEYITIQKETEQNMLRDKKVKEAKEREKISNEILRCKEILKLELKTSKELKLGISADIPHEASNILPNVIERTRTYSQRRQSSITECIDHHRNTKTICFTFKGEREVFRGCCLGHSERGHTVYGGIDQNTGELLIIIEWTIDFKSARVKASPQRMPKTKADSPSHTNKNYFMKQIANIEQELSFLMKLKHLNLVHYLNMKYAYENDKIVVYLLQEFAPGGHFLSFYLNDKLSIEIDTLRHFATGLLNAIDHLHENNVVHKDLRYTNIFMDNFGNVKLANYSIDKRLVELYQGDEQITKYSKKHDILRIGIILISLLSGSLIEEDQVRIPVNLPQVLKDFLLKFIDKNERTRWSSDKLLNHQFIKSPITRPLPNRSADQSNTSGTIDVNTESPDDIDIDLFIPTGVNSQSRIKNEFELLKWLGKGAFGDVLKVRNRLDGGSYAIKRIELNPRNKSLNKKITREVKLLSRLYHENVVRYYNSWIESATIEKKDLSDSSVVSPISQMVSTDNLEPSLSFGINEDIEKLAPPTVEWSVSYSCNSKKQARKSPEENKFDNSSSESEDDDDDDEDGDDWTNFFTKSSDSDSIEFKNNDSNIDFDTSFQSNVQDDDNSKFVESDKTDSSNVNTVQIQYLYIQMEFCEKSTLRNAIDNDLYLDTERMWRLFREIVEGLSHIHQQGMIHRDLKPVNIFLDSNDQVKIGDFGLATNITILPKVSHLDLKSGTEADSFSNLEGDGSMTGQVGTALYVAPELITTCGKAIYNQKVDIYSLGIILFEMSYMPLKTGMERVKILGNMRLPEVVFPDNFINRENKKTIKLIRWLLNHDGSDRPTCAELLQCEQLIGALEEFELQDVLQHALSNKNSKTYRQLMNACFLRELTPAENVTYDINLFKSNVPQKKQCLFTTKVKEIVEDVFKLHGGVELTTPLLLPYCQLYDPGELSVRLMTHNGEVVNIPHNLRVPFARYVVCNEISMMKRYSIDRVYREEKHLGFHPREMYECSFDIVTPNPGNHLAEAELLSIVYEITNKLPAMKYKNMAIKLNHAKLLNALLINCGIDSEKFNDVYKVLALGKLSHFQFRTYFVSLCLSDESIYSLGRLIDVECTIDKLGTFLKNLVRKREDANVMAKEAMRELDKIVRNAEVLGVKCPIYICPCMVYKVNQYSGMMVKFVCELKKKRRKVVEEIAAGGRYDNMLTNLSKTFNHGDLSVPQSAAGISLSLEKLVQGTTNVNEDDEDDFLTLCGVYVCSTTHSKIANSEMARITGMLWNAGIKAYLVESINIDDIQETSKDLTKVYIIVFNESEPHTLRIRVRDKDRFDERKVDVTEIVEYIQGLLKTDTESFNSSSNASFSSSQIYRSDSKTSNNEYERPASVSMPNISINFCTPDKLAANIRKRTENQIMLDMRNVLQRFTSKNTVKVLAVTLECDVLRTLTSFLEIDSERSDHDRAVRSVIERHNRHKQNILLVSDSIYAQKNQANKPIIALYSIYHSVYKILL